MLRGKENSAAAVVELYPHRKSVTFIFAYLCDVIKVRLTEY